MLRSSADKITTRSQLPVALVLYCEWVRMLLFFGLDGRGGENLPRAGGVNSTLISLCKKRKWVLPWSKRQGLSKRQGGVWGG